MPRPRSGGEGSAGAAVAGDPALGLQEQSSRGHRARRGGLPRMETACPVLLCPVLGCLFSSPTRELPVAVRDASVVFVW